VLGYLAASSVPVMILMRLLTGVAEALFFVGAASAISDLAPDDRRGEALSFFSLALYAGIGVGPIIGEAAIAGTGFSQAWLTAAAIGLMAVLLALPVPDTRPSSTPTDGSNRLVHRAAVVPGLVLLTVLVGLSGFFAFVPLYARELGLRGSRLVFVMFSMVVILIRSFGAKIPDRLGPATSSRAALAFSGLGLLLVGGWNSPLGLYGGTVVFGIGVALATPALMALAIAGAPASERGWVIGTFTAFVDLGFGLGPVALGFVAAELGDRGVFLTGATVAAAGLLLLVSRQRRSAAA
jgi:MFS family permease